MINSVLNWLFGTGFREPVTVASIEAAPQWTAKSARLEEDLYLENPLAFWLRPDRDDFDVPCWQIEGEWERPDIVQYAGDYSNQLSSLAGLMQHRPGAYSQYRPISYAHYQMSDRTY